uniref:Uncharacterized protein n=1 Tax=Anguilla anguilla TaxID=7936 RepID=A0A0E9Q8U5_ANGAN
MSVLIQYTAVASLHGRLQNVTQPIVHSLLYNVVNI